MEYNFILFDLGSKQHITNIFDEHLCFLNFPSMGYHFVLGTYTFTVSGNRNYRWLFIGKHCKSLRTLHFWVIWSYCIFSLHQFSLFLIILGDFWPFSHFAEVSKQITFIFCTPAYVIWWIFILYILDCCYLILYLMDIKYLGLNYWIHLTKMCWNKHSKIMLYFNDYCLSLCCTEYCFDTCSFLLVY